MLRGFITCYWFRLYDVNAYVYVIVHSLLVCMDYLFVWCVCVCLNVIVSVLRVVVETDNVRLVGLLAKILTPSVSTSTAAKLSERERERVG